MFENYVISYKMLPESRSLATIIISRTCHRLVDPGASDIGTPKHTVWVLWAMLDVVSAVENLSDIVESIARRTWP